MIHKQILIELLVLMVISPRKYVMGGTFSIKSDVFAFGVLLLEILSGKKSNGWFYSSDSFSLLGHTWKLWQDNKTIELLDPVLEVSSSSYFIPLRYTHVGLLCVQETPDERPTMLEVVAMLNNEQTALAAPQHPAFTARSTCFTANPGCLFPLIEECVSTEVLSEQKPGCFGCSTSGINITFGATVQVFVAPTRARPGCI